MAKTSATKKPKPRAAAQAAKSEAAPAERAVLVTTQHRGVFFGYATHTGGETIKLRAARCCLRWSAAMKGFLGLATLGPDANCRIGPAADIELRNITSVADVTAAAATKWEAAPWG